jgi:hypothetical protein
MSFVRYVTVKSSLCVYRIEKSGIYRVLLMRFNAFKMLQKRTKNRITRLIIPVLYSIIYSICVSCLSLCFQLARLPELNYKILIRRQRRYNLFLPLCKCVVHSMSPKLCMLRSICYLPRYFTFQY